MGWSSNAQHVHESIVKPCECHSPRPVGLPRRNLPCARPKFKRSSCRRARHHLQACDRHALHSAVKMNVGKRLRDVAPQRAMGAWHLVPMSSAAFSALSPSIISATKHSLAAAELLKKTRWSFCIADLCNEKSVTASRDVTTRAFVIMPGRGGAGAHDPATEARLSPLNLARLLFIELVMLLAPSPCKAYQTEHSSRLPAAQAQSRQRCGCRASGALNVPN